jgi:hypothetical protein
MGRISNWNRRFPTVCRLSMGGGLGSLLGLLLVAGLVACATTEATSPPASIDGTPTDPLRGSPGEVSVIVFSSTDCPVANALAPTLARIHADTVDPRLRFQLVHVSPGLTEEQAEAHAREYDLGMMRVLDPEHRLVRALGATVTPEAVVLRFDEQGRAVTVYAGRINDLFLAPGRRRPRVQRHDLREAIDAALAGRPFEGVQEPAVGCLIEPLG